MTRNIVLSKRRFCQHGRHLFEIKKVSLCNFKQERLSPSLSIYNGSNAWLRVGVHVAKNVACLQVNYVKRSSFDFVTHFEFSSLALQI